MTTEQAKDRSQTTQEPKITAAQIEAVLSQRVMSRAAQASIQALSGLIAGIINEAIPPQEATTFINDSPSLRELFKELSSKDVSIAESVISFGKNNNLGDVQISGDVAGGNIIKFSLFVTDSTSPHFTEINQSEMNRFVFPQFLEPRITEHCLEVLQTFHILVLHGDRLLNEAEIARFLALKHAIRINGAQNKSIRVLNWTRTSQLRDIDIVLSDQEDPCIFVLAQVTPELNGTNFFHRLAQTKHFVIVTTDLPFSRWNLANTDNRYWINLAEKRLFEDNDLINKLLHDLVHINSNPTWKTFINWDFCGIPSHICGLHTKELIDQLQTPQRCELFVRFLDAEHRKAEKDATPISQDRVKEIISMVNDLKQRLDRWYFHSLTTREQFMVIGLSCFSGLYDNQFFAALDRIIQAAWRNFEATLNYTDYSDLANLCGSFFKLYETNTDSPLIESNDTDQRLWLFIILWKTHRRRIVTALPTLVELTRESTRSNATLINGDLYGDEQRRSKLRIAIAETFSDVGMISLRDVRNYLFLLATESNMGCQAVAAHAVARWQSNPSRVRSIYSTLEEWLSPTVSTPKEQQSNLRSSALLALSYILEQFSDGSELPMEMLYLLNQVINQASPRLRYQVRQQVIPKLHPNHLSFVQELLFELACHQDTHDAISTKLTEMYQSGVQNAVIITLQLWTSRVSNDYFVFENGDIRRRSIASLTARTLSNLLFRGPVIEQERVIQLLESLSIGVDSEDVRDNILLSFRANTTQDVSQINQVNRVLHLYLRNANSEEIDKLALVMATLNIIYYQPGSNDQVLTNELLHRWIAYNRLPKAQQVAFRSFTYIAAKSSNSTSTKKKERRQRKFRKTFFRHSILLFFGTLGKRAKYRKAVRGILPEVYLQLNKSEQQYKDTVKFIKRERRKTSYYVIDALDNVVSLIKREILIKTVLLFLIILIALIVIYLPFLEIV